MLRVLIDSAKLMGAGPQRGWGEPGQELDLGRYATKQIRQRAAGCAAVTACADDTRHGGTVRIGRGTAGEDAAARDGAGRIVHQEILVVGIHAGIPDADPHARTGQAVIDGCSRARVELLRLIGVDGGA